MFVVKFVVIVVITEYVYRKGIYCCSGCVSLLCKHKMKTN